MPPVCIAVKKEGERVMKAVKWLDRHFEEVLLVALLFIMMIIMGIQIVARYALGIHFPGRRRSPGSVLSGPDFSASATV